MIAGAVIAAIPTIIFFLIFQRNIMSGLDRGQPQGLTARSRRQSAVGNDAGQTVPVQVTYEKAGNRCRNDTRER